ncbi:MAG: hypothetical protein U0T77_12130 [Chitinophagales bacterium]
MAYNSFICAIQFRIYIYLLAVYALPGRGYLSNIKHLFYNVLFRGGIYGTLNACFLYFIPSASLLTRLIFRGFAHLPNPVLVKS